MQFMAKSSTLASKDKPTPATISKRSNRLSPERQQKILELLADGYTPEELACKLGKNKPRETRRWLRWTKQMALESEEYQAIQAAVGKGEVITELPAIMEAIVRRAKRGRTDAAKLAFEIVGFHNPKVSHEHSGDISVTLNMPRPERVENPHAQLEEPVVDAEVVED